MLVNAIQAILGIANYSKHITKYSKFFNLIVFLDNTPR